MRKLIQYRWFRSLFKKQKYFYSNGSWINYKNFDKEIHKKVEKVEGPINTLAWCACGNELIYSKSFERYPDCKNLFVYNFKCTCCGEKQSWTPDIHPGLFKLDTYIDV